MDKCGPSDAEFDSYWDYEAKNKNRNRIRVGRQYQASVPPLLKPGEKDGRKCEDLETLKWKPHQMNELDIEQYLSMAKAVTSFAEVIENSHQDSDEPPESPLQIALKGLVEFVTSHHPCHRDTGCKVPASCSSASLSASPSPSGELATVKAPFGGDWTDPETRLFAQAVESHGKNFCAIKKEYLPWKPVKSLIEYYYAKEGKSEEGKSVPSYVPNKVKEEKITIKEEPVACCSRDNFQQAQCSRDAKEEGAPLEVVSPETELRATSVSGVASSSTHPPNNDSIAQNQQGDDAEARSTVGSLKFFLGGRLVLKLNAQQDNSAGTKCQWVQSNEAAKHGHSSRKQKHRRKMPPETSVSTADPSPKSKKSDESTTVVTDGGISATKKAKLKGFETDSGQPSLCSVSWTPPIADGRDSVELEDGSSKTSEGCVSPIVMPSPNIKLEAVTESKRKVANSVDYQDRKVWSRGDSGLQLIQQEGHYGEDHSPIAAEKFSTKPVGDESSHSYDMLNHKSALSRIRGSNYVSRTAHSGSPSSKLFNKWPSPSADFQDRVKCSPSFPSPNSRTCSSSSENSVKADHVLDLSSRLENCESQVDGKQEVYCRVSPEACTENCSSSDGSPHTPCSSNDCTPCCKSSNCSPYHSDVQATCREGSDNHRSGTNIGAECKDRQNCVNESGDDNKLDCCSASNTEAVPENSANCPCCYNSATLCSSLKCCKSYSSSKEPLCNKKNESGKSPSSSPNSMLLQNDEVYAKKMPEWMGGPVPLVHMYSQCFPYYVTYGMNPAPVSNSTPATAELPLDLSSNGSSKEDKSENVPQEPQELSANSADAMDRGMLYQLLKNRVTK